MSRNSRDQSRTRRAELKKAGALWVYSGVPGEPHAVLTSGLHSDGFCNMRRLAENPAELERMARHLASAVPYRDEIDRVIGPAYGAIRLAHEVARAIGCKSGIAKPVDDEKSAFVLDTDVNGERVFVIDDVVTTAGSMRKVLAACMEGGAQIHHHVGALIDRSESHACAGHPLVSLVQEDFRTWPAEECPLCQDTEKNSEAIKSPKDHWDEFMEFMRASAA